ncbi:MAG: hypothetical protein ACYDG4_16620 [Desulfuromonadaceae bacterium]
MERINASVDGEIKGLEKEWDGISNGWTARIKELETEVARLEAERIAIQNDTRALTCVFCGMVYPPGTPPSNHAALVAHVEVCPKHPLQRFKQRAAAAETYLHHCRKALNMLETTDEELLTMKGMLLGYGQMDLVPVIDAELEYRRFQKDN